MSTRREPSHKVIARQIAAADPDRSVFVSANAGSGKTHVLAQRVINLLLRGTPPEKVLCITFTKAAAANMATRVFDTLAAWTKLDDAALDARIEASTGKPSDAHQRAEARRLFATALETPGGLKVQTIHAFCTRLLHQFPFEADVAAGFEVLDDAATAQMLNELTLNVMLQAAAEPEGTLGRALAIAITATADITFKELIAEAIGKRDKVAAWVARAGEVQQAVDELSRTFGLDASDSLQAIEDECLSRSLISRTEWTTIAETLAGGSKTDSEQGQRFLALVALSGRELLDAYLDIFCTTKRDKAKDRIVTAKIEESDSHLCKRLNDERDRIWGLLQKKHAVQARDRSAALLTVTYAVLERYRAAKERRGVLDYEDLIDKTLALFKNTAAAWVLYKLDLGIDHVLVDEAQDTSPKQWEIIRTLVAEFGEGGAREDVKRTVFAVGDEKQSIFSFQGAAPLAFAENRRHFALLFTESFVQERLEYSFRSGPVVLGAVDTVFAREQAFRGLSYDEVKTAHQAVYDDAPGEVEIWELIAPDEKDKGKEGWDAPFDTTSETSPAIKLAAKIARAVKTWCAGGTHPRDVLILVRQRGPLFEAVIRALKREGIAVAGADRLVLPEHIAVMDLLVLGDALLLPDDDLALATVLKSPLFGLSEGQLYDLAYGRKGPLRSVLRAKASEHPTFATAVAALDDLAAKARRLAPFAFYAHVLGARGGRRNFLARLGIEASDPLDEFLNLALDYERRETPSLQGFLDWIRAAQSEVKRDMEMERDEVRVMTVHGAKGLEAKNVILIDGATTRPEGAHPPRLLTSQIPDTPNGEALIWAVAKDKDAGPMAEARAQALDAARDEYRRLLYVGMTRAAERLIVCGTKGVNKAPDGCWHQLVLDALKPESIESDDAEVGKIWRFSKNTGAQAQEKSEPAAQKSEPPEWLRKPVATERVSPHYVTPSETADDDLQRFASGIDRTAALLRGHLTHRLLQSLPDIPTERRARAAAEYLARAGERLTEDERRNIAEQVDAVLNNDRFRDLFGPGSRAEVPVVGRLLGGTEIRVAGQIDRLAVMQDAVLIADFKTSRNPPRRVADAPSGYVRQLALYRAVLARLYPDKPVHAALIWTEVPDLMELSADILDAALMQVTPA